jgi:hypothetical protein
MTNEELQEKFEQLASEIDWIKTKLVDLQEEKGLAPVKTSYEVEVPEDIGEYYYVSESGDINLVEDVFHDIDYEGLYLRGLAFKTKEEAEQFDKERVLLFKLHKWTEEHNKGWKPNWKDMYEGKYIIQYINKSEILEPFYSYYFKEFSKLPYFKSEEIALQCIDEFGEKIKEVLY